MVAMGISAEGATPPVFRPKGLMINSESYVELVSNSYAPFAKSVYKNEPFLFQQDGASPPHQRSCCGGAGEKVRERERYAESAPTLQTYRFWIFYLWDAMGQVVQAQKPKNLIALKTAVCTAWSQIDMEVVRKAIRESWPKRIRQCVAANGGKFEHTL